MPESSNKTAKVEAAAVVPTPTNALKKGTEECINMSVVAAAAKKKEETSGDDYENSDAEDAAPSKTVQKPVTKKEDETSEESESESESEEESDGDEPQKKKTKSQAAAKRAFLERFPPPKGSFKELFPASTTLFVVKVPYSTRRVDLEDFFKPAGKVVNYMFSKTISEHYCNAFVALDTPEAAKKALELNGLELLGSKIRFEMDTEYEMEDSGPVDAHMLDPLWGASRDSYSREPLSGSVSLFTGFSEHDGEAEIRNYVEKIFENSSEPPKVSIPKKKDGSLMRFAYLVFPNEDASTEAEKQPRRKVGERTLFIDGPLVYQQEN